MGQLWVVEQNRKDKVNDIGLFILEQKILTFYKTVGVSKIVCKRLENPQVGSMRFFRREDIERLRKKAFEG
jgi:hypothetical protein